MSTELTIAVPAVVLLVGWRQLTTRRVDRPGLIILAVVLAAIGVTGGIVERDLLSLSVVMLVVDLVFAAGAGVVRAMSVHVWRDEHGVLWSRGTWATVLLWGGSVAGRIGLYGIGAALGLSAPFSGALLFVGVTIGVQALVVARRASRLPVMSSVGA